METDSTLKKVKSGQKAASEINVDDFRLDVISATNSARINRRKKATISTYNIVLHSI